MIVKVNNLDHCIDDGYKFMNTLLKDLNRLSKVFNILHRNGIPFLYDEVRFPRPMDIVKSSINEDKVDAKLFEDWSAQNFNEKFFLLYHRCIRWCLV